MLNVIDIGVNSTLMEVKADIEVLLLITFGCGPYDNLKPSFCKFWWEVSSSKPKLFGKKGVSYREATIELILNISLSEKFYASSQVQGSRLLSRDLASFEKRLNFRGRLR